MVELCITFMVLTMFYVLSTLYFQKEGRFQRAIIKDLQEAQKIDSHSVDVITRYVLLDIIKKSVDKQDYETASEAKKMVDIIEKRISK